MLHGQDHTKAALDVRSSAGPESDNVHVSAGLSRSLRMLYPAAKGFPTAKNHESMPRKCSNPVGISRSITLPTRILLNDKASTKCFHIVVADGIFLLPQQSSEPLGRTKHMRRITEPSTGHSHSTSCTKAPLLGGIGGPKYRPTFLPSHSSGTPSLTPSLVLIHLVNKGSAFSTISSSSAAACI